MSQRRQLERKKPAVPRPRPWVFKNGVAHRHRRGARVPEPECLPPFDRVGVRQFCLLMEEMGAGDLDLGDLAAP